MGLCSIADVYAMGIPPGGLPNPGRLVSSVNTADNILTVDGHGLEDDDEVTFRAEAGGSLPGGLSDGTTYYVISLTDATFKVAASAGGSAVNITSVGSNVIMVAPIPFESAISWATNYIEQIIPANSVPVDETAIPECLRALCADLAASRLKARAGVAFTDIATIVNSHQKIVDRWLRSVPVRGTNAPAAANLARSGSATYSDPRGWARGGYDKRVP